MNPAPSTDGSKTRRTVLISALCCFALALLLVMSFASRQWIVLFGTPYFTFSGAPEPSLYIAGSSFTFETPLSARVPAPATRRFALPGFSYRVWPGNPAMPPGLGFGGAAATPSHCEVSLSLWLPFIFLAAYPTFVFMVGPLRAAHRHMRKRCGPCGYSLVGSVSGICSECGQDSRGWALPRWERCVIAALCGVIANWLVEFFVLDLLFNRGPFRGFRTYSPGSGNVLWMVPSFVRAVLVSATAVAVYVYLSPDRFEPPTTRR